WQRERGQARGGAFENRTRPYTRKRKKRSWRGRGPAKKRVWGKTRGSRELEHGSFEATVKRHMSVAQARKLMTIAKHEPFRSHANDFDAQDKKPDRSRSSQRMRSKRPAPGQTTPPPTRVSSLKRVHHPIVYGSVSMVSARCKTSV